MAVSASQEQDPLKQYAENTGINKAFYDRIAASSDGWKQLSTHLQPPYTGVPYFVPAGGAVTLRQTHGPQINDLMFVNATNLDEYGAIDNSLQIERSYNVKLQSRVWTCSPYMRPITTVIEDGANYDDKKSLVSPTAKWHFWGPHCCSELIEAATGVSNHPSCQTMFEMAWETLGVPANDPRTRMVDVNVFQPVDHATVDDDGFMVGTLYPGFSHNQYITFYAEMDMYILVIQCPFGNQEKPILEATCWPQTVEIYDTGARPEENEKFHTKTWNLKENQAAPDSGLPAPAKRIYGVNTLEEPTPGFNTE